MKRGRTYSIRTRMLAFFALMTLTLLLMMILFAQRFLTASISGISRDFYTSALSQSAGTIDDQMESYRKISAVFSSDYALRSCLWELKANPNLYNTISSRIKWAVLKFPNKDLFANIYVYPAGMPPVNCYYDQALFGEEAMAEAIARRASGAGENGVFTVLQEDPYCLSILDTVEYKGEVVGVIRFDLGAEFLTAIFSESDKTAGAAVRLADKDGRILFSRDLGELFTTLDPAALQAGVVTAEIPAAGWIFVATLPEAEIQQTTARFVFLLGVMILLVMLIVAGFTLASFNSLLRPMRSIVSGMNRVKQGDLSVDIGLSPVAEYNVIITTFHQMVEKIRDLLETVYYQQTYLRRAQIGELQSKFSPHFLYNTLDMIYWRLVKKGDDDSAEMIVALSDLLRYSITHDHEFTPLREEERQIANYLTLQSRRLGADFQWEMDFAPEILELKVPCLLLQPLVENAVNHAFTGSGPGKYIGVSGRMEGTRLILLVVDNGVGMSAEKIERVLKGEDRQKSGEPGGGTGLGIALVHKRLQYIYGEEFGIQIVSEENRGCLIRVTLSADREAPAAAEQLASYIS